MHKFLQQSARWLATFAGWSCLLLAIARSNVLSADEPAGKSTNFAKPAKIYLIGNSLTWDTLPSLLDGDVQWHVDCGKSLQHIHDHPDNPCVKSSTPWPTALKEKQFDFLCVQPFSGTTLVEDVTVISRWIELQPRAVLILHTGWNYSKNFEQVYHATLEDDRMVHSPAYFARLASALHSRYPQLEIRSTHALETLDIVWHDVERSRAPYDSFGQLYRDDIHMTTQDGRYLMHNIMRQTLGQPTSTQGFQVEADQRAYLDVKLDEHSRQVR